MDSKRFFQILEYNYYKMNEDDDLDLDMEDDQDGEDIDAELGLEDGEQEMDETDSGNEVEIDVTDIVKKQEELMASFDNIIAGLNTVSSNVSAQSKKTIEKIEDIENNIKKSNDEIKHEIIKRNPTPNEKLQLRSMNSYPYNLNLSDYWTAAPDIDEYEKNMSTKGDRNYLDKTVEDDEQEYKLTVDDIDNYSEVDIAGSF